nr:intracellular protein transport protein USO1 isoform X2 [Halyomorpha halys]
MEDSQPLRRSTRNSVALKNEELTPRKRKVSTPAKVEPSTPSRRTRASSATPKKNLIEVMSTPKKTLPVLDEEENPASSKGTPVKKIKEISPKTPSRRKLVRESVSTPTRASIDKSTKKPVDAAEEINVPVGRPLTRAKRKTMGEIQTAEVNKTSESEKSGKNKKDRTSVKSASISEKTKKSPDIKSDKKLEESCLSAVPKGVNTVKKPQSEEEKETVNLVEENECGIFTTKSPVRAEDIAINSPRKVPENYKSNSETSLKCDINSKSQTITVNTENSVSSVENTDISSTGNTNISSVEQGTSKSPINTNLVSDITTSPQKDTKLKNQNISNVVYTSPQKVTDVKDNSSSNIVITSPQKDSDLKDNSVSSIVITSPLKVTNLKDTNSSNISNTSPQTVTDSKDNSISNTAITSQKVSDPIDNSISNIVITSPKKGTDSKDNIPNIVITSPQKITDLKDNNSSNVIISPQKVTDPKDDSSDIVITSPQKVTDLKDNSVSNSAITSRNVSIPKDNIIPNIVVTSPQKVTDSKDNDNTTTKRVTDSKNNVIPNIVITSSSPQKLIDSKDNIIPNIVITSPSPQKLTDSKDNIIPNIVITFPSPQKVPDLKDNDKNRTNSFIAPTDVKEKGVNELSNSESLNSNNVDNEMFNTPEKMVIKLESDSPSEEEITSSPKEVKENSQIKNEQKIEVSKNPPMEEKSSVKEMDGNSKKFVQANINKISPTKTDIQNNGSKEVKSSSMDTHCPEKVAVENISNDINGKNSVQAVMQVSSVEISHIKKESEMDMEMTQVESEGIKELNKTFDRVKSNENIPNSVESSISKDIYVEKSAEPDSQIKTEESNVSEIVPNEDDVTLIENKNDKESDESKLDNSAELTLNLDCSSLSGGSVEKEGDEITSNIPVVKESVTEEGSTQVENEKTDKDDESTSDEASPSSTNNTSNSLDEASPNNTSNSPDVTFRSMDCIPDEDDEVLTHRKDNLNFVEPGESPIEIVSPIKPTTPDLDDRYGTREVFKDEPITLALSRDDPEDSSSPIFFIRCDECPRNDDDSGDSGILNDDNVIVFKMASHFKDIIRRNSGCTGESSKSEASTARNFDDIEANSEESKCTIPESGTSVTKHSPKKSDENEPNIPLDFKDRTETVAETFPKSSESTEDCTNKIGIDAILMSPKDFLNSDEESNVVCEKYEDSRSKNGNEPCNENKSSEDLTNTDVDQIQHSTSETDGRDVIDGGAAVEEETNVSTAVLCDKDTEINPIDHKIPDGVEACVCGNKEEIFSHKCKEKNHEKKNAEDNQIGENKSEASSSKPSNSVEEIVSEVSKTEENAENSLGGSEAVGSPEAEVEKSKKVKVSKTEENAEDSLGDLEATSSPEAEVEKLKKGKVSKTEGNVQDSLAGSEAMSSPEVEFEESKKRKVSLGGSEAVISPEVEVEKSTEDGESSNKSIETKIKPEDSVKYSDSIEEDGLRTKPNLEPIEKNTKYNKNRRNAIEKLDSETDGSQSDDSELSGDVPSNAATEGSSGPSLDVPWSGRDFIDFEAEEGEETSTDDSFIVSSASSSSDAPSFTMKLRKRKRHMGVESPDSPNYIESVQRLFDSCEDSPKDDEHQDDSVKNKKPKLEKVSTVKKSQRPKSNLRNKLKFVESVENRIRTRNKTDINVIKEPSKTGVFIVSSIDQNFEEPKLSQNSSKRISKLHKIQNKSQFPDHDYASMGFGISGAGEDIADDAALRGFVVSYDESYIVSKKPRKAVIGSSELMTKKKKIKEGKKMKKAVKRSSLNSESKGESKSKTVSPFVVTLILPFRMSSHSLTDILEDLGLNDISSINFPKPKVGVVEFSNKESYKKILKMYGEIKVNDRPIYILEGCSL